MDLVQYKHDSLIWKLTRERIDTQCHYRERLHPDPQKFPLHVNPAMTIRRTPALAANDDVTPLQKWEV